MRTQSCTPGFTLATVAARRVIALTAAALAAAAIALAGGAQAKAPKAHLSAFPSCSSFVHYARRHALGELKTMGTPGPVPVFPVRGPATQTAPGAQVTPEAAPVAGQDYSTTNVQEEGVDEPDMVKTDGKTIFAVENQRLYAIDTRSDPPKLLGSIAVDSYGSQLLLHGDTLLVLGSTPIVYAPGPVQPALAPIYAGGGSATLMQVDVSDPSAMKVVKTMSVNGSYLDARMTGHSARVVFSAIPQAIPLLERVAQPPVAQPASGTTPQRKVIAKTTTPNWRPTYVLRRGRHGRTSRHALVRCTSIRRPVVFSGLDSLTVLTIDLDKGLDPVDSDGVMTDGQIVYGSPNNLYVATEKAIVEQLTDAPPPPSFTEIHKFDVSDPDQTTYKGSGTVSGTLLNNYSMSEQDGFLRVASTELPLWWNADSQRPGQSFVSVLAQRGDSLATVGRVGNLGAGERIYAVRFIGDVGYVVTFRQVDPLYTVGLSDPEHPRVLGSLELLGYSAYLHPVGDKLLLGVGEVSGQGHVQGTQLSLFDVSDPAKPTRIAQQQLGSSSSSSVEFDPHAFLWWEPSKLAVLPVEIYDQNQQNGTTDNSFTGAIGFHVTKADGIAEAGRITHPAQNGYSPPLDRSLVIGDELFTVSATGVRASDLGTFADRGFAQFPQAQNPAPSGTGTAPPGQPATA